MTRTVFRDFDDFAGAINGIAGQFVPTARSVVDWWVEKVPLGRIALQQVQIGGAATFAGDGAAEAITIGVPLGEHQKIRIDGERIEKNSILRASGGKPFTFSTQCATQWMGIEVPMALLDDELRSSVSSWRKSHSLTQPSVVETIRRLASRVFSSDPGVGDCENAAHRCLEEEAVMAISLALKHSSEVVELQIGRPKYPRARIICKALMHMEERAGQPLLVADLCRAAQVSERTLQYAFLEYFGVGPMRLLKVRQLREIRFALLNAEHGSDTVAKIAARFGVWDFSLFARNYRSLYGEAPSATLRRPPPNRQEKDLNHAWIRYAAQQFLASSQLPQSEDRSAANASLVAFLKVARPNDREPNRFPARAEAVRA